VAPPRQLYEEPANVFVAGFIGNPPMNIVPITDGGRLGDQRLPLPDVAGAAQAGIRPEAFAAAADRDRDAIRSTVEHVEFLGHETIAHVRVADQPLIVRLDGMLPLGKGAPLRLRVDPAQIYLFDAEGRALHL
jgi:ABC-type sugar transport system ATPase subunit